MTSRSFCTCNMAKRQRCWSAIRTSESKSCWSMNLRGLICSRWDITAAPPPARRSFWPRSIRASRWCLWDSTTPSTIRGRTLCSATPTRRFEPIAPTSPARSRSSSTATRSRLRRLLADRLIRISSRATPVSLDGLHGILSLVRPDEHHHAADAGQNILRRLAVLDDGVDPRRLQQAAHHHRLRFLFRIEDLYQFLVILCRLRHGSSHGSNVAMQLATQTPTVQTAGLAEIRMRGRLQRCYKVAAKPTFRCMMPPNSRAQQRGGVGHPNCSGKPRAPRQLCPQVNVQKTDASLGHRTPGTTSFG